MEGEIFFGFSMLRTYVLRGKLQPTYRLLSAFAMQANWVFSAKIDFLRETNISGYRKSAQ